MAHPLEKTAKEMPISPGIYQFIGVNGEILYVGKAKSLRNRIKSYFAKEIGRGAGIDLMVMEAVALEYIETESEIEAIILEANLINRIKPKYNIRLRDDKSFLVLRATKPVTGTKAKTKDELYSKVELVRAKNINFDDNSSWYFGPYPAGLLLKKSLNYLRKIFPFRDCSKTKFLTYKRKGRPCIYGDIRVCTAPCVDWVTLPEYQKNISYLISFLKGNKKSIISDLKKRMGKLSKEHRFEEAALLRDKLAALDHLKEVGVGLRDDIFNGESILFKRIECYDISNIGDQYAVGSMVVFVNGKKNTDEYRRFKIKPEENSNSAISGDDLSRLKHVLERRFQNDWPKPDLVVIDGGVNQLNVARKVLEKLKVNIPVISIAKGPQRKKNELHFSDTNLAKYARNNASLENIIIATRDEAHRFAISYYRKLHQKDMLEK